MSSGADMFQEWFAWIIILMLFAYLSRELEIWKIIKEIEMYLGILKKVSDKATLTAVNAFKEVAAKSGSTVDIKALEDRVKELIESVIIEPESRDPYGVVDKLKHIVLVADENMTSEVLRLVPKADLVDVERLKSLVSAAHTLRYIYKYIDHYYRLGKRFKSLWLLLQLQSLLPFIHEEIKALESGLKALDNNIPIGDSAGPLVAAKFAMLADTMSPPIEIAKETLLIETTLNGRKVLVIKAKGPMSSTGRLDDAVENVIAKYGKVSLLIFVDAAAKFEGEKSGTVVEGVGVAIGGLGIEKFNIEKIAARFNLPIYSILIKMSSAEALSVMTKDILQGVKRAVDRVKHIVLERCSAGSTVLLIGVGNTVGVLP